MAVERPGRLMSTNARSGDSDDTVLEQADDQSAMSIGAPRLTSINLAPTGIPATLEAEFSTTVTMFFGMKCLSPFKNQDASRGN